MSLYGVQRASSKTDRQVIDKECFEDVLGNTRGQLVNLQSKACHSQDTASWNTFLWVEFIRECCPNSDSDSPVPEIFWNKTRQSASEASLCILSLAVTSMGVNIVYSFSYYYWDGKHDRVMARDLWWTLLHTWFIFTIPWGKVALVFSMTKASLGDTPLKN